jgi:hypothetical protein
VPLSNNTISRRIQHIAEDLNDQLIEKWGWLCPIWFHNLRKCAAINRLIHPTNYYNTSWICSISLFVIQNVLFIFT